MRLDMFELEMKLVVACNGRLPKAGLLIALQLASRLTLLSEFLLQPAGRSESLSKRARRTVSEDSTIFADALLPGEGIKIPMGLLVTMGW